MLLAGVAIVVVTADMMVVSAGVVVVLATLKTTGKGVPVAVPVVCPKQMPSAESINWHSMEAVGPKCSAQPEAEATIVRETAILQMRSNIVQLINIPTCGQSGAIGTLYKIDNLIEVCRLRTVTCCAKWK